MTSFSRELVIMIMLIALSGVVASENQNKGHIDLNQAIQSSPDDARISLLEEVTQIGLVILLYLCHYHTSL